MGVLAFITCSLGNISDRGKTITHCGKDHDGFGKYFVSVDLKRPEPCFSTESEHVMNLSLMPDIRLLDDAQLQRILEKALQVLGKTAFRVQATDEFADLLRAYGCRVEGEEVRFPATVIDKVMARCEAERKQYAATLPAALPAAASGVSVFTHGQALHICDPETNQLRSASEADLASWCHLVESMGITARSHPTFIPTDVPMAAADLHAFVTILRNSRQPYRVSVYSAAMLPFFIEACRIAKGSLEAVKKDPVFATKAWVTSPFMLDRENIEIGMDARRLLGTPITFGHMPVAGASTPITLAGALLQNTAESLALSAMRLAVDDLPQPITGTAAVMDMKHGFPRQIGPDLFLHHLAGQEMHDFLYRGRQTPKNVWGWCGAGAATVSTQSVCEKALGFGMAIAGGTTSFGVGCLAFSDVGSPVQLVIDCELAAFARELRRDINLDEAHLGMDAIEATIPTGGKYLEALHTAEFFREECWLPSLFDYQAFMAWANNPGDMIARAAATVRELGRKAENPCPLSAEQKRQLDQVVKDADAAAEAG
jgi:trimethylamine--corrinoid protein Co-methyltransferase